MENAAKALLIAGGILIALIITSMLVYTGRNVSQLGASEEARKEAQQLSDFNKGYESYAKKVMYGADVISVINKAQDNNIKYQGNDDYKIYIYVDGSQMGSSSSLSNSKMNYYKCTDIVYSNVTGRVQKMYFVTYNKN